MGGVSRKGVWELGPTHTAFAMMAGIDIDLREARFTSRETVIHANAFWAGIDIIVNEHTNVIVEGIGIMGAFDQGRDKVAPDLGPDSPTVRVKGVALMAGVTVQRRPMPGTTQAEDARRTAEPVTRGGAVVPRTISRDGTTTVRSSSSSPRSSRTAISPDEPTLLRDRLGDRGEPEQLGHAGGRRRRSRTCRPGRRRRAARGSRSALSAISSEKAKTRGRRLGELEQPVHAARAGLQAEGHGDEVVVAERRCPACSRAS